MLAACSPDADVGESSCALLGFITDPPDLRDRTGTLQLLAAYSFGEQDHVALAGLEVLDVDLYLD